MSKTIFPSPSLLLLAALALGVAVPGRAAAQSNSAAPAASGGFGDPALKDFSLGQPKAATKPAPAPTATPPASASATEPVAGPVPSPSALPDPATQGTASIPTDDPLAGTLPSLPDNMATPSIEPIAPEAAGPSANPLGGFPWTTILIGMALVALLLFAAVSEWRKKARRDAIGAALAEPDGKGEAADAVFETGAAPGSLADAAPAPSASTAPAPAPRGDAPEGLVTSSMRAPPASPADPGLVGSVNLQSRVRAALHPQQALLDADGDFHLVYDILVENVGSAPAREVEVEALLVQAGPDRDRRIADFFAEPIIQGAKFGTIGPMSAMAVQVANRVRAKDVRPVEHEGRALFIPFVAVKLRHGSLKGMREEHASFVVGIPGAETGKLGPLRIDGGARRWEKLEVRQHSDGLAPTA